MAKILITGGAGFIGFHLAQKLINGEDTIHIIDNFNDYYDVELKHARAKILFDTNKVEIFGHDLNDSKVLQKYFITNRPDIVIHLAAHAGVRHSLDHTMDYIQNNIVATQNLIAMCEIYGVKKVIYASTSCVMAGNPLPWREDVPVGHQLNPYGYTKRTNECQFMTSKIPNTIGLRFFTVYGPYGRPDMALFQFANSAVTGAPVNVFNYGDMKRDFTYVDDIVNGIIIVLDRIICIDKSLDEIYNIGRGEQIQLMDFISEIETNFDRIITKNFVPKHPADTLETWSDTTKLQALGWKPSVSVPEGVAKFCEWYKAYYEVN
jgi:UDP-glucuronate 4-epimerase